MVYPRFPPSFWSFGYIKDVGGFSAIMPPLGLAILAALVPPEFDVQIVDENVERTMWIAGDSYVNVLRLNLILIQEYPSIYSSFT